MRGSFAAIVGSLVCVMSPQAFASGTLTGDWGGLRSALADNGIDLGFTSINEALGTFKGGIRRGWIYEDRIEGTLDLDLEKLVGLQGVTIHASAYQIDHAHGRPAADYTASIADPSNIEARAGLRLFTLWAEASLPVMDGTLRVGQIAADDEFFLSETAGGLINSAFGWAPLLASNQVQGGPVYPLATPGMRLQISPIAGLSFQTAIFAGDPAGHECAGDPQACNRKGVSFPMSDEPLFLSEMTLETASGALTFGGWWSRSNGDFIDQRLGVDLTGALTTLADPAGAEPLTRHHNWGLYGVADQLLWTSADKVRSIRVFLRGGVSPSDRNLVSAYVDSGVSFTGFCPRRPNDSLTLGVASTKISRDARRLDREILAAAGTNGPIRTAELVLEASYTAEITPWLVVQPDLQFIHRPAGGIPRDDDATRAIGDALIGGVRLTFTL